MIYNTPYARVDVPYEEKQSSLYSWSYKDKKTGKMVSQTIDQCEQIQSVDYITLGQIMEGGIINGQLADSSNYFDTTQLPTDIAGLQTYIQSLQKVLADEVAKTGSESPTGSTAGSTGSTAGSTGSNTEIKTEGVN